MIIEKKLENFLRRKRALTKFKERAKEMKWWDNTVLDQISSSFRFSNDELDYWWKLHFEFEAEKKG